MLQSLLRNWKIFRLKKSLSKRHKTSKTYFRRQNYRQNYRQKKAQNDSWSGRGEWLIKSRALKLMYLNLTLSNSLISDQLKLRLAELFFLLKLDWRIFFTFTFSSLIKSQNLSSSLLTAFPQVIHRFSLLSVVLNNPLLYSFVYKLCIFYISAQIFSAAGPRLLYLFLTIRISLLMGDEFLSIGNLKKRDSMSELQ